MKYQVFHDEWSEKILARLSGELSLSDLAALNDHLASCSRCAEVMREYELLTAHADTLSSDQQSSQLPARMLILKEEITQAMQVEVPNKIFVEHLHDKDSTVRAAAVPTLGMRGDLSSLTSIQRAFDDETDEVVQGGTIEVFGRLGQSDPTSDFCTDIRRRETPFQWQTQHSDEHISCSVGIMAYNEEANISHTIHAILDQQGPSIRIEEIIVVASGCADRTVPIVTEIALKEPRVRLCIQEKREGKASAINLFLKQAVSPVAVLISADVLPETFALEYLCSPFKDPKIGMVGGCPVPVNNPATLMGHAVHLLWRLHDQLARVHPKLGEAVAFRNVISGIPSDSAVGETSIQALISQLGYELVYDPACIVYNKGPLTIRDFLKQRRRIYAGHLKVRDQQNYAASTMKIGPIVRQLIASRHFALGSPRRIIWTLGAIFLEMVARVQGYYDYLQKREHHIWQMVDSTKDLQAERQSVRHMSQAQSTITFRIILEGIESYHSDPEGEDRAATEATRKLLPLVRSNLSKEDTLSISGPGIMTAVIRAEQQSTESVAKRIQEIVQATPMRIGMTGREVKVTLAYSSQTFPLKTHSEGVRFYQRSDKNSVAYVAEPLDQKLVYSKH